MMLIAFREMLCTWPSRAKSNLLRSRAARAKSNLLRSKAARAKSNLLQFRAALLYLTRAQLLTAPGAHIWHDIVSYRLAHLIPFIVCRVCVARVVTTMRW
jgi:hypothetical protein